MSQKSFNVHGMHCAGCANSVEKALRSVDGVSRADVNIATGKATVYSDTPEPSVQIMKRAVSNAGFELEEPDVQKITFAIEGMHCAGCTTAVEKAMKSVDGVTNASVNLTTEKAYAEFTGEPPVNKLIERVREAGYEISVAGVNKTDKLEQQREREKKKLDNAGKKMIWSWVVTAPLMLWMFLEMVLGIHLTNNLVMELAMVGGAGFVIFGPGFETITSAWKSARNLTPNMDVLIALGTVASFITGLMSLAFILGFISSPFYSFAGIAAMIMAFHLTGRYVETKARGRASEAITKLLTLEAKTANIIVNGKESEISTDELKKGDTVIIRPGEKIPSDGTVADGKSTVDESMVTGESMPVLRKKGEKVIGGTISTEGTIYVTVTEVGEDTFLNQVIKLVEEAQGSKIPVQEFADRVTAVFVPVILVLATLTFFTWWLLPDLLSPLLVWADYFLPWIVTDLEPLSQAFFVALAVLVIACPCALGLATPTALMVGSGLGAENGILIRRGEAIQRLNDVTTFVFDKTGTLTKGEPEVTDWISFDDDDDENSQSLKKIASSVENLSEHPISRAITKYAEKERDLHVDDFQSYTGMGVKGEVNGKVILIGNAELLKTFSVEIPDEVQKHAGELLSAGKTTIFIVVDNLVKAVAGITDTVKEQTHEMIRQIKQLGYKTVILTGDQQKVAARIAGELGIDEVLAEVKPGEKAKAIERLQNNGEIVAMVGDGVNDAPALSQSDVGIALGTGTDIAIESGSVILIDGNPEGVVKAVRLSKATFKKIRQNLFWAFFYNLVMLPVAMAGWMHPVLAEAAMAMSSVNVVGNSRRLRNKSLH
ncbi:MAG: heavy metal translocating P-type ATPase [Balneolaceae bacterium]